MKMSEDNNNDSISSSTSPGMIISEKEIRRHIEEIAVKYGSDGVSYILVKDKLVSAYGREVVRLFKSKIRKEIQMFVDRVPTGSPPRPPPIPKRRRNTMRAKHSDSSSVTANFRHRRNKTDGDLDLDILNHGEKKPLLALRCFKSGEKEIHQTPKLKERNSLEIYRNKSKRQSMIPRTIDYNSNETTEEEDDPIFKSMRPAPLKLGQKSSTGDWSTGESSFGHVSSSVSSPKMNVAMTPLRATVLRSDSTSSLQRFGVFKSKDAKHYKCLIHVHRGYLYIKDDGSKEDDIVLNVRGCRVNIICLDKKSKIDLKSGDSSNLLNYAVEIVTHHDGNKTKLKIGCESMKMLYSIKTLILLASVPAMVFIPGRMLKSFEAVGSGTTATVYKASYMGATVALKRLSASFNKADKVIYEGMIAEIQLLTQLRHPNVINFLGICYNPKSTSDDDQVDLNDLHIDLVMDYYPLCLRDFLYDNKYRKKWSAELFMKIVGGIINGVSFLHSASLIHRDLKVENIMLDTSMSPRLADFGASFQKPSEHHIDAISDEMTTRLRSESSSSLRSDELGYCPHSPDAPDVSKKKRAVSRRYSMWNTRAGLGTPIYLSPELIPIPIGKELTFSRGSDVFAFGIVLWELWSRTRPYENFKSKFQVWHAVIDGYRLPMTPVLDDDIGRDEKISSPIKSKNTKKRDSYDYKKCTVSCRSWPKSIVKIIEKCCDEDPAYRPSFTQIQRKWQRLVNSATDPLEDMIIEAGPWFPADVKSAEIFQFEGLVVREDEVQSKYNDDDDNDKEKKADNIHLQKSESFKKRNLRTTTWSSHSWAKLVIELLRSNHIRISRQTDSMDFSKVMTISLHRCRIAEQLRHSLHPKSVFTLGVEILGPNTSLSDRALWCVVLRSSSKDRLYRFQQRLLYRRQRNMLSSGNLLDSPRKRSHPEKITKENVNNLFEGQSHASWYATRGDVNHLRELFEQFQCTRLQSEDGSTVLHDAASAGSTEVLIYLLSDLKVQLSIDCTDNSKRTPLSYACERGHVTTVKLLLKHGADPDAQDENGMTPFIVACKHGWEKSFIEMLNTSPSCVDAGLIVAASCGHDNIVSMMMTRKCCANDVVRTALEVAAARAQDRVVDVMLTMLQKESTTKKKRSGIDLSFHISSMLSPLVSAASFGHVETARIILEKSSNFSGFVSMSEAMSEAALGSHTDIVKLLLRHGGGVSKEEEGGKKKSSLLWSPIQYAEIAGASGIVNLLRATSQQAESSFLYVAERGAAYEIRNTIARLDRWIAQRSRQVMSPTLGFFKMSSMQNLNLTVLLPKLASRVLRRHADILESARVLKSVLMVAHDRALSTFDV